MNHLSFDVLNLYLDNQLEFSERAELERHLVVCSVCQDDLAQLRMLFTKLQMLSIEPIPVDLTATVLQRIEPPARKLTYTWLILVFQVISTTIIAVQINSIYTIWIINRLENWLFAPINISTSSINEWFDNQTIYLQEMFIEGLQGLRTLQGELPIVDSPQQLIVTLLILGIIWLVGNQLMLNQRIVHHASEGEVA